MTIVPLAKSLALSAVLCLFSGCSTVISSSPLPNRAAQFNGVDEYIVVKDAAPLRLGTGDFTLAAWVFIREFGDSHYPIMAKRDRGVAQGWTWYVAGNQWSNLSRHIIFHVSQGNDPFALSTKILEPATWYHLAVVYSAADKTATLYINGEEDSRSPEIPPPSGQVAVDLHIGREAWHPRYYFNGMMDDLAIYAKALSREEIGVLGTRTPPANDPGLVSLWTFDGSAADSGPDGHHGVLQPAP